MQSRVYQTKMCSLDERRVIDVWCGLEQSTINMAIDTSVEDLERASIRKEDHSNTACELTLLICQYLSITPKSVFVLKGSAAAK